MGTNYRAKPLISGNVNPDVRISGMFRIEPSDGSITTGAGNISRPSAGSSSAAGAGELWTATQITANTFSWRIALTEQYFAPVWVRAAYNLVPNSSNVGTATTYPSVPVALLVNGSTATIGVTATAVDLPISTQGTTGSNTFYIFFYNATTGAIPAAALAGGGQYNLFVVFEACFKNSVSPNTR